ncbi:MAG: SIR2 family protein [Ignavibacteria bacterium]|jgi:hypothetical protein
MDKRKKHKPGTMKLIDNWNNDASLKNFVANQLYLGRLALVLGAGISLKFKLPNWKKLIKNLYIMSDRDCPKLKNLKKDAELFKSNICSNNNRLYIEKVKNALYLDFNLDFKNLIKNDMLSAIAAVVMASKRGNVSNVISFNYDDLLERYLGYHGYVVNSVTDSNYWNGKYDVNIFHPHGFLPSKEDLNSSKEITLDMESYSKVINENSNPWRQYLLSIMRTHFCIFIGLSGDDENLDSLLLAVKDSHISLSEGKPYYGLTFLSDESNKKIWSNRGIYPKMIQNYDKEIPEFLYHICQIASNF